MSNFVSVEERFWQDLLKTLPTEQRSLAEEKSTRIIDCLVWNEDDLLNTIHWYQDEENIALSETELEDAVDALLDTLVSDNLYGRVNDALMEAVKAYFQTYPPAASEPEEAVHA